MWPILLLALIPTAIANVTVPDFNPYLPSTCERVRERGQECSLREAQTADGYLLTIHRVHSPGLSRGPPVLLIHGLLSASDQWLVYGRDHDLPSILADKGYDVWLGDLRGNVYSRKHLTLDPETPEFWNFSLHEHGYYDIPAMVDLICLETGHKKIFYIGYSVGGSVFIIMASTRPEYNAKIRAAMLIAPYVFAPVNLSKIVKTIFDIIFSVMRQWRTLQVFEVFPRTQSNLVMNKWLCHSDSKFLPVCLQVYDHIFGVSKERDQNIIYDVISTFRSGSSAKVLNHVSQVMYTNSLRYFDYENDEENMKAYGKTVPPEYNLTKITAAVSFHYSYEDNFMNIEEVAKLSKKLPNFIGTFTIPMAKFNHIDYLAGIHARELVYEDIFNVLFKYSGNRLELTN